MICYIPLPKTSLKQICIEYNIPFRRTVRDYCLEVSDSSGDDTSDDESHLSIEDTTEVTISYASQSMTRKKKKKSKKVSKSSSKKRKTAQQLVSNKRQKTCGQNPRVPERVDKKWTPNDNKKSERRAAKRIPNGHQMTRKDENRVIEFLGERFRYSDVINDFCECQQNCELDELSMAFDLIMRLPEDQLPKDLKIAVKGKSADNDFLSSEDDRSDPNLDEYLPPIDYIYQQTIEEDYIEPYLQEFFMKTNRPILSSLSVNLNEPQASTSSQSSSYHPFLSEVASEEIPILNTSVTNGINNI